MNKVTFPLKPEMQGAEVGNLQAAMLTFLDQAALLRDDEASRQEFSAGLQQEHVRQEYGNATRKLVSIFQRERQLQASGTVDEVTADAINILLHELGMLEEQPISSRALVVSGIVRRQDGLPLGGILVRAVHEAVEGSIRLGEDRTDAEGRYTIRYELLPQVRGIDLRISGIGEDGKSLQSSEVIRGAKPLEIINLTIPIAVRPPTEHRIEGRIVLEHGLPAEQVKVRLYRREFGGKTTLMSETTTLSGGQYAFAYDLVDEAVSLEVRAVNGANEVSLSKPLNHLSNDSRTIVNLVAPTTLQPMAAEYSRLLADLIPHVEHTTKLTEAKEDDERQDLTVLNRATGWDARLIALACTAERLSADLDVELPQEAVYGLLRAGLPSDKVMLSQIGADIAEQALKGMRDAGIIEFDEQQIAQFKRQFETFSNKVRLTIPTPGSRSTYGELLKASGLSEDAQAKFASVYLSHRGDPAQLWESARATGLDDAQIRKLQIQGKLAFLAGNSLTMVARLVERQINDPVELVDQDFYRADQWKTEIRALAGNDEQKLAELIPISYNGKKVEDRLDAYADDLARKVRLSYPTQVVGRMIEQDGSDSFKLGVARTSTAKLLKNAADQGFRLGQTPVESFFKTHAGVVAGMTNDELADIKNHLKTLHRVYQITPSNEAMPVLLGLGLTSAYDVAAVSEEVFLDLHGPKFPTLKQARLVYRKAKQVSAVTYNLFTIAKKMESEVSLHGLSAPAEVRQSVKNELIKHYPTMESLFGSMDFCECEHCRSVLSPAAYLVDLMQFIDAEPDVWGNFLTGWRLAHKNQEYTENYEKPYDALIERRPDLPHISLTCENTHTALPYIDIVNEILEFYVANGKLEEKAARDTGDANTSELLAEPQNVVREAYDKLFEARYPLNLPFDLWIETVRQFCDYFETPLAHLLEVFRLSDDLFSTTQHFDRASIFLESLGLSPAESAIFTDANPLVKWNELYGFKSAAEATTLATDRDTGQRIDLNSAKALSRRLGVTYKEVVEIIQTGFVNPKLAELAVLHKLGVTIHDVLFYGDHKTSYEQNKDLLGKERSSLSGADQKRFDKLSERNPVTMKTGWENLKEVEAFEQRLNDISETFKPYGFNASAWLDNALQNNAFDDILLLADPDAGCNFDLTTIRYASGREADDIAFLRINLFVRVWRKLGWTIQETDRALQVFVPKNAPFEKANLNKQPLKTALIYLAHLKALDQKVRVGKQSRLKLITLWSDIATKEKNSLYAQLFLTRSILKSDDVFDHPLGQYLSAEGIAAMAQSRKHMVKLENVAPEDKIDPAVFAAEPKVELWYDTLQEVQHIAFQGVMTDAEKAALKALAPSQVLHQLLDAVQAKGQEFALIKGHLLALEGALGLTADDISRILEDADKSLDMAELSLSHVSLLYRYGLLAKALQVSVQELIALKKLAGIDPFKLLQPEPLKSLDEDNPFSLTLRFVQVAEQIRESGLSIEDLEYLLLHRFDETGKYRPNRDSTLVLLKTLAEGVRAMRAEHAVPDDPASMSEEILPQKLGLALPPGVVERFLAMLNGTVEFTATKTGVEPGDRLEPKDFADEPAIREVLYYDGTRREQKLTVRIFDPHRAGLEARHTSSVFVDLMKDVQTQAREFFDNQLKKQKLRLDGEAGFLDDADFTTLFDPLKPLVKILPTDTPQEIKDKQKENEKITNDNQTELQKRRYRVSQAFFPYLQQRLIRQFIVQTMTAHTAAADPTLVESLLTDVRLLSVPIEGDRRSLVDVLSATAEAGTTATFFASTDGTGPNLKKPISLADANTGLKDSNGNPFKPAGANSAHLEGYLEVPTPGAYRFFVVLGKKDAEAQLRFAHLAMPTLTGAANNDGDHVGDGPDEYAQLKPGIPYRFTLDLRRLNGGEAQMMVQGETLPKDNLAQLALYPVTTIEAAEHAIGLLTKALQLLQTLAVSEHEARYLLTHAEYFDKLNLSNLPTQESDGTAASVIAATERFAQFLRLAGYARLKRDLAGGTNDLIEIFEANGVVANMDKVYSLIAKLTRREDASAVKAAAKALFAAPTFLNEKPLQRLWEALQVVERFGVPVASLLEWTRIVSPAATPEQRFWIARDLRETIKARFQQETWQRVARPIFDKLRQRQRDALVVHVMDQHGFDRMEKLYEYFLIDPGMEPVVQTSRIRLAIASVQLFIQRCLLNLERKVHPSAIINAKHWEWMKRYRVWEANRKIFLFPENWLEPEFRDDKTHLFSELEGTLLQGDVSTDLVEDAFLNYLKKLDELARLDIVAMHLEDNPDPANNKLHVIGRTFSKPHKYFYRRYAHQMWTPWEVVTVEIESDHLAPVVWRDRLYLFWVTFMEKADQNASTGSGTGFSDDLSKVKLSDVVTGLKSVVAKIQVDVQLHWSEYFQGEWTTSESGGFSAISQTVSAPFNPRALQIHVSKAYEGKEEGGVYIHLGSDLSSDLGDEIMNAFFLVGRNSVPEETGDYSVNSPFGFLYPYYTAEGSLHRRPTRYSGSGEFGVAFYQRISTEPGKMPEPLKLLPMLKGSSNFTLLPCDNRIPLGASESAYVDARDPAAVKAAIESGLPEIESLMKPVFYQDNAHNLFIEPNVTERTTEEWEDWVARPPQPERALQIPDWWKEELVVIPEIPRRLPILAPEDGKLDLAINPESVIKVKLGQDWLVNPGTGLLFQGELIGRGGRAELEPRSSGELADAITEGNMRVNVNAGSGVPTGNALVIASVDSLKNAGLTQIIAGGLNVVGTAGFNSVLAKNLRGSNRSGLGAEILGSGGIGSRGGDI